MKIKVEAKQAHICIDQILTLGSTYELEIDGYDVHDKEELTLVVTDCDNNPVAKSEAGSITLNSISLVEMYEGASCGEGKILHCYLWSNDGVTIGTGLVTIAYSPLYSDAGEPIVMRGSKGDKGDAGADGKDGADGADGKDGANGVYVPMDGLYAFHVSQGDGDHPIAAHLWIHGQDTDALYAHDADGNLLTDENGNYIPLYYIDKNGHLIYRFLDNGKEHQLLDLGNVRGPAGPQGAKGDAGLTEEEKEAISKAFDTFYNNITNVSDSLSSHQSAQNPHGINPGMIGAVDAEEFTSTINATREEFVQRFEAGDENVLEQVKSLISKVLTYKGSVATYDDLPDTDIEAGDVYNVEDTGMNYAWNGFEWDALGGTIEITADMVKISLPQFTSEKLSDWLSAVNYVMNELPSPDSIKEAMSDSEKHINNTSNPHKVTPEQIGALPTVDGIAENLKKKTATDTKTISFSWGTGSYGTIKAVFDEYGFYEGLVDISGNWVRNPQENLSIYSYGSVSGLREDLYWYNVSCSDYVYPDENASDDNYNYVYNFYLGYDESNGYFLEVAFEMYEYNEETGDYEYRYIVEPCSSTSWEDIIIDSPVLSEYELLDDAGQIKSEKIPPISESDPRFNSWKNGSSIAAGSNSTAYSSDYSVAMGPGAKATGMSSIAIGRSCDVNGVESAIAIGNGAKVTNTYGGVQIGKGTNSGGGLQFGSTVICREGAIPAASLDIRRYCYVDVNSNAYYAGPENIVLQTRPFKDSSGNEYPSSLDSSLNQGAIIIGNGAKLVNQTLTPRPSYFGAIVIGSMTGVGMYSTPEQVAAIQPPQTKYGITIGSNSISDEGVSIGHRINSIASRYDIVIGSDSISTRDPNKSVIVYRSSGAVVIGKSASGDGTSVTIGYGAKSSSINCVVIGRSVNSNDAQKSIALGFNAKIALSSDTSDGVLIENAVQLGSGTNSKSNSLQFLDTTLFENGKLNLDTVVLNDSVANEDGTVNKYKLKVTNGVLGVELITEEVTA